MRAIIQRVTSASVTVEGEVISRIDLGLVVLLGVGVGDSERDAEWIAEKTANLRIFEDADEKMNLSLLDVHGSALVVSQFTLYGDARKGRRPSFTEAASPAEADKLYKRYVELLESKGVCTQTGIFQARMLVSIENDGPVTILLNSPNYT